MLTCSRQSFRLGTSLGVVAPELISGRKLSHAKCTHAQAYAKSQVSHTCDFGLRQVWAGIRSTM